MKTIMSAIAAATLLATVSSANALDAQKFFDQQQLYGENTSQTEQIVNPFDVFEQAGE